MKTRTQHGHCGHGTDRSAAGASRMLRHRTKGVLFNQRSTRLDRPRARALVLCARAVRAVSAVPVLCPCLHERRSIFCGSICLLANARPPRRTMFPVISVSFFGILLKPRRRLPNGARQKTAGAFAPAARAAYDAKPPSGAQRIAVGGQVACAALVLRNGHALWDLAAGNP